MPRYDDDDRYSAEPPRRREDYGEERGRDDDRERDLEREPLRHSGAGVASFVMSLVAGIGSLVAIGIGVYLGLTQPGPPPPNDPAIAAIGFGVIGSGLFALIGIVLGLVGAFQSGRRVVFAILGTVFNVLILLGICGVVGFGLAVG